MTTRVKVENGKYTFEVHADGVHVLRHGEPWLVIARGSKALIALVHELCDARETQLVLEQRNVRLSAELIDVRIEREHVQNVAASTLHRLRMAEDSLKTVSAALEEALDPAKQETALAKRVLEAEEQREKYRTTCMEVFALLNNLLETA